MELDFLHYTLMGTTAIAAIVAAAKQVARNAEYDLRKSYQSDVDLLTAKNEKLQASMDLLATNNEELISAKQKLLAESNGWKERALKAEADIRDFQSQLNAAGQKEVDTNAALGRLGQALVNLKSAIAATRNAGKIAPKARQELNATVDQRMQIALDTAPKKVGVVPMPPTSSKK